MAKKNWWEYHQSMRVLLIVGYYLCIFIILSIIVTCSYFIYSWERRPSRCMQKESERTVDCAFFTQMFTCILFVSSTDLQFWLSKFLSIVNLLIEEKRAQCAVISPFAACNTMAAVPHDWIK